jgi:hypothetical protein
MRKLLIYCILVILPIACSRENAILREASQNLESDPESALYLLDSLDRNSLSEREKATFDYLTAYSFYRTYYFLDDASEAALQRACLYFENNGPAVDRMRAWELMGTVQTATNRYGSGLVSFLKAEQVARSIEKARLRTWALLFFLVAVLATLLLYFWARKMQMEKQLLLEREENDRIMSIAEDLQNRLSLLQGTRKSGRSDIGLDMLDRLCEQYYVYEGTSSLQPKILKEVRSLVEGLRSDDKAQKNLEQSLNDSHDQVMKRLRAACPKWKDEDYLLYMFTVAGFSSTTISTLLEKDKPYVYNRLYRIKERIKASEAPDRDFLLLQLEK